MEMSVTLNSTFPTDLVLFVTTFRIIVLTWNRPKSLQRLLDSIENSDYNFTRNNPGWELVLEIRVDGEGGDEGTIAKQVARDFQFSHGSKVMVEEEVNRGIMQAWRRAWTWREKELFIIIEDDVEMSPHWYRVLVNMWRKYGEREDLAGIGLQRQTFVTDGRHDEDIGGRVMEAVYMYQLPASIGCSPHPWLWNEMIQQHGDKFGSCPEGMSCVKEVWEAWWLAYSLDNNLFTLYAADKNAFAVDHREKGYHYEEGLGKNSEKIGTWIEQWEKENLPDNPKRLDLGLKEVTDLGCMGRKIAKRFGAVIVRVLTNANIEKTLSEYKELSNDDMVEQTMFVLPSKDIWSKAKILPNVVVETPSWLNTTRIEDPIEISKFWVHILKCLSTLALKVVSLPSEISLSAKSKSQVQYISSNIVAGKQKDQSSPRLDHLYLDGSYNTFFVFLNLDRNNRDLPLQNNFLANFKNNQRPEHAISWSWISDFII